MLIEYLTQTLEGDNPYPSSCQVIAPPDKTTKVSKIILRKTIVPEKFEKVIQALKDFIGESCFQQGTKISLTPQEMLKIAVREKARIDAYSSLIRFLKNELDIDLIVTSNKTKNKNNW